MCVQCEMEWREFHKVDEWALTFRNIPVSPSIVKHLKGRWINWCNHVVYDTLEEAQLATEQLLGVTRI